MSYILFQTAWHLAVDILVQKILDLQFPPRRCILLPSDEWEIYLCELIQFSIQRCWSHESRLETLFKLFVDGTRYWLLKNFFVKNLSLWWCSSSLKVYTCMSYLSDLESYMPWVCHVWNACINGCIKLHINMTCTWQVHSLTSPTWLHHFSHYQCTCSSCPRIQHFQIISEVLKMAKNALVPKLLECF